MKKYVGMCLLMLALAMLTVACSSEAMENTKNGAKEPQNESKAETDERLEKLIKKYQKEDIEILRDIYRDKNYDANTKMAIHKSFSMLVDDTIYSERVTITRIIHTKWTCMNELQFFTNLLSGVKGPDETKTVGEYKIDSYWLDNSGKLGHMTRTYYSKDAVINGKTLGTIAFEFLGKDEQYHSYTLDEINEYVLREDGIVKVVFYPTPLEMMNVWLSQDDIDEMQTLNEMGDEYYRSGCSFREVDEEKAAPYLALYNELEHVPGRYYRYLEAMIDGNERTEERVTLEAIASWKKLTQSPEKFAKEVLYGSTAYLQDYCENIELTTTYFYGFTMDPRDGGLVLTVCPEGTTMVWDVYVLIPQNGELHRISYEEIGE